MKNEMKCREKNQRKYNIQSDWWFFFTSFAQLKEKRGRFTTGTTMTIKSCKFKITFYSITTTTTTTTNKPKKPTTQRETTAKQYVISILKISASQ